MFATCAMFLSLLSLTRALVLSRGVPQNTGSRDWQSAVQNINGMNSILTLLPVLTGKVQNVKLVASRTYPASFVVAGIGAGRVLSKLQVGILLWSFDLYRNTVADLSYAHDEYINHFMPILQHVPSGTPERHTTNTIINHNLAEAYMVEAWFQTRGSPSILKLKQNNYMRMFVGYIGYLVLYSAETFLAVENAADGTGRLLMIVQTICVCTWLTAITIIQMLRGQGNPEVRLNCTGSSDYRCFRIPTAGDYIGCETLSFHLDNLNAFQIYGAGFEQPKLAAAGLLVLISGVLDIVSTVLIIGFTSWAYSWIGTEVFIIIAKVIFCLEPTREIEIASITAQGCQSQSISHGPDRLPLRIQLGTGFICQSVTTEYNTIHDSYTDVEWRSTTAGLWIGQAYEAPCNLGAMPKRYLAIDQQKKLALIEDAPEVQKNQALQREFLAALVAVVASNKVPSQKFVESVETTLRNVQCTMSSDWYAFGSKAVLEKVRKAKQDLRWRHYL